MAIKSALFDYVWFIPEKEIADPKPTAFLLRQMSKKDMDIVSKRTRSEAMLTMLINQTMEDDASGIVKEALTKAKTESGFEEEVYRSCVKEIRNIYVEDKFVESITDPDEIVKAVAGLKDSEVATELDSVLWNISTLEEFEAQNFTPTSGYNSVCRTRKSGQNDDGQTANSVSMATKT